MTIFSYMLTVWGVILWLFRAVVCVLYTNEADFIIQPLNLTFEIILLFATIPCIVLVFKRNIIGAACYMAVYVSYFGTAIYNTMNSIVSTDGMNVGNSLELFVSIIGIIIPVLTFFDILLNKNRKSIIGKNRSTDWYYKNKDYDRKLDERADKNNYRTL